MDKDRLLHTLGVMYTSSALAMAHGADMEPVSYTHLTEVYSKEQIRTLLQAAYEYHSVYLAILLALFVGLRKGEILGLQYSEFFKN